MDPELWAALAKLFAQGSNRDATTTRGPARTENRAIPDLGRHPVVRASGAGDRANSRRITRADKMDEGFDPDAVARTIKGLGMGLTGVTTIKEDFPALVKQVREGGVRSLVDDPTALLASALMFAGPWGEEANVAKASRRLYHFSNEARDVLKVSEAGSGPLRGAERARSVAVQGEKYGAPNSIHAYTELGQREQGLGNVLHTIDLPADAKLLDVSQPLPPELAPFMGDVSKIEQEAKRLGYAGIENPDYKSVKLFNDVKATVEKGNPQAREYANSYLRQAGLSETAPEAVHMNDPLFHGRVAKAYDAGVNSPNDPAVKAAYKTLAGEVEDQWNFLTGGKRVKIIHSEKNPYNNSAEMMADVRDKGQLKVYAGDLEHPLLTNDQNLKLRAVHDYFGHAAEGHQFGPLGEERAYREHARMFTPAARRALATETRGQNSWVNFGPNSHLPVTERPYATQKAFLLPEEMTQPGYAMPQGAGAGRPWSDFDAPPPPVPDAAMADTRGTGRPTEDYAKPPADWDPFDAAQAIFQSKKPR